MTEDDFRVEERVLCSDDTCIGLVGADGRCKVCEIAYEGDAVIPSATVETTDNNHENEDNPVKEQPDEDKETPPSPDPDVADTENDRVCCSDDTCVGIIGEDGLCGTCGKPL